MCKGISVCLHTITSSACVSMSIYMCIHTCLCLSLVLCVCVYVYMCMQMCMSMPMFRSVRVHMYVTYVCMHVSI